MSIMKFFRTLTLTAVLVSAIAYAQTPYDEGQKALREQNWTEAAEHFNDAIKADRKNADASMYWRAHALYKAGRNREAERQVATLTRKFPDSRWVKEAQMLIIEHENPETEIVVSGSDSSLDEDLRMFALARLMESDPDRAMPMVLEMIENAGSENVSSDLLFMLGMSDDPEARKQIARIARDSSNPRLQADAIHMLGIASDRSSLEMLSGLYRESGSKEVKEAVIEAHIVSGEPDMLIEILKTEQDPAMQKEIIHALGAIGASGELDRIYPTLANRDSRVAALEAFTIAGDTAVLRKVLETETDPEIRKTAIQGIAIVDDADAARVLESVYDNAASQEEKKMVLEALVMMDDAKELALKVARTETDQALRRDAIHMLGVMEATDEMAKLYGTLDEAELRKAVLESMMVADDTEGLIEILKTEADPKMRAAAIQALGVGGGKGAADYLASLYPKGSDEEKSAVIQSMLIMNHAKGLIDLLDMEDDPDRKREILQMLSLMDSKEANDYLFKMLEKKG